GSDVRVVLKRAVASAARRHQQQGVQPVAGGIGDGRGVVVQETRDGCVRVQYGAGTQATAHRGVHDQPGCVIDGDDVLAAIPVVIQRSYRAITVGESNRRCSRSAAGGQHERVLEQSIQATVVVEIGDVDQARPGGIRGEQRRLVGAEVDYEYIRVQ